MRRSSTWLVVPTLSSFVAVRTAVADEPRQTAAQLMTSLEDRQYLTVEAALTSKAVEAETGDFFKGVVANRNNRLVEAERLLRRALNRPVRPLTPMQEKIAWRTLADTYTKLFRYADAADTYQRFLERRGPFLSSSERDDAEGTRRMVEALRDAPKQTVRLRRGFRLPTRPNAIHTIEALVTAAGQKDYWILDTGANISIVARSKAAQLGLRLSEKTTPVHTFSGAAPSAIWPSYRRSVWVRRNYET